MSDIFSTLKEEGFEDEDIRDVLLEEGSDIFKTLIDEGNDSQDVLDVFSEATGLPSELYDEPKKVDDINQRKISILEQEKETKLSNLDLSEITDDEERVKLAKEKIALKYDERIDKLSTEQDDDRTRQIKLDMQREKRMAFLKQREESVDIKEQSYTDTISEYMANAGVITQQGSPTDYIRDFFSGKNDGKDSDSYKQQKLVAQKLAEDNILKEWNPNDGTITTNDGYTIKLESGLLDDLMANFNQIAYSTTGGIAGGLSGAALANPYAVFTGAKLGSATGAGIGAGIDYNKSAKVFGIDVDWKDVADASLTSFNDDVLIGSILEGAIKGAKYGKDKLVRLKNHFVNDSIDEAFDYYLSITGKTEKEVDNMISTAAEAWGIAKPNVGTTEGKKQAFKFIAFYDNTIGETLVQASTIATDGKTNLLKNLNKNSNDLKKLISSGETDGKDFVRNINNVHKESQLLYSNTKEQFLRAFEGVDNIDYNEIGVTLNKKLDALVKNQDILDDSTSRKFANVVTKASNVDSAEGVLILNKLYNEFLRGFKKSGKSLSDAEYKAIISGKDDIQKFISKMVKENNFLDTKAKTELMTSLGNSNRAYKMTSELLDTDLYSSIVSKRENIKKSNKVVDSIIESAKGQNIKTELDEASVLLGSLSGKQRDEVESVIFQRIMEKKILTNKKSGTKIYDMSSIADEINDIKHIFKSDSSNEAISTLNKFSSLIERDTVSTLLTGVPTSAPLSGGGLSTSVSGAFHIAAIAKLFKKIQVLTPAILKDLGVGSAVKKLPIVGNWAKASSINALELNIAKGLDTATDIPSLFKNVINDNPDMPKQMKGGMVEVIKQYQKINDYIAGLPMEEQKKLAKIEKANLIKLQKEKEGIQKVIDRQGLNPDTKQIPYKQKPIYQGKGGTSSNMQEASGKIKQPTSKTDRPSTYQMQQQAEAKAKYEAKLKKQKEINNKYKEDVKRKKELESKGQGTIDFDVSGKELENIDLDIKNYSGRKFPTMNVNGVDVSKSKYDLIQSYHSNRKKGKIPTKRQQEFYDANQQLADDMYDMDWKPSSGFEKEFPVIEDFLTKKELNMAKSYMKGNRSKDATEAYKKWSEATEKIEEVVNTLF